MEAPDLRTLNEGKNTMCQGLDLPHKGWGLSKLLEPDCGIPTQTPKAKKACWAKPGLDAGSTVVDYFHLATVAVF